MRAAAVAAELAAVKVSVPYQPCCCICMLLLVLRFFGNPSDVGNIYCHTKAVQIKLLPQDERDQLRARLEDALLAGGAGPEAALGRGTGAGLNPQVSNRIDSQARLYGGIKSCPLLPLVFAFKIKGCTKLHLLAQPSSTEKLVSAKALTSFSVYHPVKSVPGLHIPPYC